MAPATFWDGEARSDAQGYLTDLITERAVEFVSRDRGDTPFFLSVHYTAPHWPWESREDEEESRRIGSDIAHVDGGSLATYHRMIHHMDEDRKAIVAALPHRRDNTLLVFVSDNGGERYSNNWPFIGGKMDLMEGGIRVPQIGLVAGGHHAGQLLRQSDSLWIGRRPCWKPQGWRPIRGTPSTASAWRPPSARPGGIAPGPCSGE